MTRTIACLFILVLLLGVTPLAAQDTLGVPPSGSMSPVYEVQEGDTLWEISGSNLENPFLWHRILQANPFLNEPGRRYQKGGKDIVVLHPGELLNGLENLDIKYRRVPIEELKLKERIVEKQVEVSTTPTWVWWVIIIGGLFLLGASLAAHADTQKITELKKQLDSEWERNENNRTEIQRLRNEMNLRREPEQLGTPVVQGGIEPTETERLHGFFYDQAVSSYIAQHPGLEGHRDLIQPVLVGDILHGMLHGEGQVRDRNGDWFNSLIEAPGRPGYQALFRYPNGTTELMQSYQACMNPVRVGEGMRGYTFVPDVVPETSAPQSSPQTTPTPAPAAQTAPAPEPTHSIPTAASVAEKDRNVFELKKGGDGEPHLIRFDATQIKELYVQPNGYVTVRLHSDTPQA